MINNLIFYHQRGQEKFLDNNNPTNHRFKNLNSQSLILVKKQRISSKISNNTSQQNRE